MRYLKTYKLFESSTDDIDIYLEKMGATRDDINDIFISLIDKGYRIEYVLRYKDKIGRTRSKKTTNYEIPILKVELKNDTQRYVGGSTKFEDLDYIENLYHGLSRFSGMYKGNLNKLTYELHSNSDMTINCYFEPEEDDVMTFIPFEDMSDAIKKSLRDSYGDNISLDIRSESNKELRLDIDILPRDGDEEKLIDELQDELKKSDKDYNTNYNQAESFRSSIIRILENDLSKRFNTKILISSSHDPVWNRRRAIDGIYTYGYTPVPDSEGPMVKLFDFTMSLDSRYLKFNVKKNFFRQKTIELEIYDTIEITLKLI